MSRGGVAFVITIVLVVGLVRNYTSKDDRQYNYNASTSAQRSSTRDKYGLLASDYDRNGWAKANGKWVSNPREGAIVRYSSNQGTATTHQSARTVTSSSVNRHLSENTNIERTLHRVADNWKKTDVNGDGLYNCIDAAVLFYQYYPDNNKVRIIVNRNPKTDFHHLFNSVLINGVWTPIEPQSYYNNRSNYLMRAVWGDKYDSSLNRDVTSEYLRYVR